MRTSVRVLWIGVVAAMYGAAGCSPAPAPASNPPATSPAVVPVPPYTPPPASATSLVESLAARREAKGVMVTGRLLLPAGTRVWVEIFAPKAAPNADPIGRSELYLGDAGTLEAGPFDLKGATQVRVLVTSHFSRSWQPPEVLALIGSGGSKLPKASLAPNDPRTQQPGGFLEHSVMLTVGTP
jgi:hypothetical protein